MKKATIKMSDFLERYCGPNEQFGIISDSIFDVQGNSVSSQEVHDFISCETAEIEQTYIGELDIYELKVNNKYSFDSLSAII